MTNGRAFEYDDLTILLGLELSDPADQVDIETIEEILTRRRATRHAPNRAYPRPATLRLVPDLPS